MKDSVVSINSTLEKIGNADLSVVGHAASNFAHAVPYIVGTVLAFVIVFAALHAIIYHVGEGLKLLGKAIAGKWTKHHN